MYECQSYAILITLQIELSVFINVLQHTTEFQQTKTEYKKKKERLINRSFLHFSESCPTWIRTKTNRTKTCCATITP